MKIKQITISMGRTVKLAEFESFRMDVSLTADIDSESEDAETEYEILRKNVYKKLSVQVAQVLP